MECLRDREVKSGCFGREWFVWFVDKQGSYCFFTG